MRALPCAARRGRRARGFARWNSVRSPCPCCRAKHEPKRTSDQPTSDPRGNNPAGMVAPGLNLIEQLETSIGRSATCCAPKRTHRSTSERPHRSTRPECRAPNKPSGGASSHHRRTRSDVEHRRPRGCRCCFGVSRFDQLVPVRIRRVVPVHAKPQEQMP